MQPRSATPKTSAAQRSRKAEAPAPSPTAASAEQLAERRARLLGGFEGPIAPVQTMPLYRAGLVLVAAAMLALPLVYLAMIGAVGGAMAWHAIHDVGIITNARGSQMKGALALYAAPLMLGGILLIFLVKPLFARRGQRESPRRLSPAEEPLLFAFVEKVCAAVGAPVPREIEVDCQVNASASFRRGVLSLLGSDLRLTIGLPLVAAMSARELAGVLAHELGHFAQGGGMRVQFLIRSVNFWFARVVFERDAWDARIARFGASDPRAWILRWLMLGLIWLTRRVLFGLMYVGHALSCFMARQMELDADRHEARLAGSETFAAVARRLPLLGAAMNGAIADLSRSWPEQRLADDFPALVLLNVPQVPPEARRGIERATREGKTGFFDTHPCDAERIASAAREAAPGVFVAEGPATDLFHDFPRLSREATFGHYRGMIGPRVLAKHLVPTAEIAREGLEGLALDRIRQRYLQGLFGGIDLLPADALELPEVADAATAIASAQAARAAFEAGLDGFRAAAKVRSAAQGDLVASAVAPTLELAGIVVPADKRPKPLGASVAAAAEAREAVRPAAQAVARRLGASLALLRVPEVVARLEGAPEGRLERARALLDALRALGDARAAVEALYVATVPLMTLGKILREDEDRKPIVRELERRLEAGGRALEALRAAVGRDAPNPLAKPGKPGRLADLLAAGADPRRGVQGMFPGGRCPALEELVGLHNGILGELATMAESLERAIGLEPLPEPDATTES